MGADVAILIIWVIQAVAVLMLATRAAYLRRWPAAAGLVLGGLIGFSPQILARGQIGPEAAATVFGASIILVLLSAVALAVAYGIGRRWSALLVVLAILGVPNLYMLAGIKSFPPSSSPTFLGPLEALGELNFFLAPIACALAFREIFAGIGGLITNWKERAA